ncbi:MAG TPA: nucleotidyltransferase family protein [Candidatus Polarisedimenticolaceae bacterium]|nr:nucleotidyltransferase family protein [Candidatus Polarisedimenticolaceae bacterium]
MPADPVAAALERPEGLLRLTASDWNLLLRRARRAGLLGRLALRAGTFEDALPDRVRDQLAAARAEAAQHARVIRWEVDRIRHALRPTGVPWVLIKGAAYVLAELPPAAGRLVTDVDVLVPREGLAAVERALTEHGWETLTLDPYDQRYYRTWMHELPPLCHGDRGTVVDVHHNILPTTGRLHPDPRKLLAAARPLDGSGLRVLAPEDLVLHGAAHLFQGGDLEGGLRDLCDLDALLRHFGEREPGFWPRLVPRARELDLRRPLYYALRFCRRLLDAPIPGDVLAAAEGGRPPAAVGRLMDALAARALDAERGHGRLAALAELLLDVRAHWLRMPPRLLVPHLSRKAWRRWGVGEAAPVR